MYSNSSLLPGWVDGEIIYLLCRNGLSEVYISILSYTSEFNNVMCTVLLGRLIHCFLFSSNY